ncbi:rna-directed dna polymerase from mobile element jockey-like protein [Lasius niger]|uniref:Rna-directed dna polymerase from mobile element jockey-like protein n=1 Tax=Lasius niger TaxID=67767 RepID=A0A0J7KL60_LASNI|nr:rna-directed dna polymerase from mobile element jockey-like protein [Lasius niger]
MKNVMLEIFNEIWIAGVIPKEWRKYQVHFIDKVGKEKVRPIALSSCVSRVMERMINERLVWWAEKNDKLAKDQNGFKRGKSCMENLIKTVSDIQIGMYKAQYTLAAFLDVTSAYDNTVQFADDIAIYVTSNNRMQNKYKLEKAVRSLGKNLRQLGLKLEPKKTVLVEFLRYGGWDKNTPRQHHVQNRGIRRLKDFNKMFFRHHIIRRL